MSRFRSVRLAAVFAVLFGLGAAAPVFDALRGHSPTPPAPPPPPGAPAAPAVPPAPMPDLRTVPPFNPTGQWTVSLAVAQMRIQLEAGAGGRTFLRQSTGYDVDGTRWEGTGWGAPRGREVILYWGCLNPDILWQKDEKRGGQKLFVADRSPDPRTLQISNSPCSEGWAILRFVSKDDPWNAIPADVPKRDHFLFRYFHVYHVDLLRSDGMMFIHYPDIYTDIGIRVAGLKEANDPAFHKTQDRIRNSLLETARFSWRLPKPVRTPLRFRGFVRDAEGAGVEGADIRLKGPQGLLAKSGKGGAFSFDLPSPDGRYADLFLLCAAKKGYYTDVLPLLPADTEKAELLLRPVRRDQKAYTFISPHPIPYHEDPRGDGITNFRCGYCHTERYGEWNQSRHARASANAWVRRLDEGLFRKDRAAGRASPGSAACAVCHVPAAAIETAAAAPAEGGKPARWEGGEASWAPADLKKIPSSADGNHCDFCHKIDDVSDPDRSGLLGSLKVVRPGSAGKDPPGRVKLTMSPLQDATFPWMGASYNPLFKDSLLCAGCHQEKRDDGLVLDDTYDAWKASDFAKPGPASRTCQECHLPPVEGPPTSIIYRCMPRFPRPPNHSHRFAGPGLLPGLAVDWKAERAGAEISVEVTIKNDKTGHAVPSGFPLRQVIFALRAVGADGRPIPLSSGPALGSAAGTASGGAANRFEKGEWALEAGVLFERRLAGTKGEGGVVWPWQAVAAGGEDERLAAGAQRTLRFSFQAPPGPVRLALKGVRRRLPLDAFRALGLEEDPADPLDTVIFESSRELPAAEGKAGP